MKLIELKAESFCRQLQLFDTSLGISIYPQSVVLMKTRRYLRGIKVVKHVTLPYASHKELKAKIERSIADDGFASDYQTVSLRPKDVLFKPVEFPFIDADRIPEYLNAHIEEYLPPGLNSSELQLCLRSLPGNDEALKSLMMISRTTTLGDFQQELDETTPPAHLYRGFSLEQPLLSIEPEFSGIIIDVSQENTFIAIYETGFYKSHTLLPRSEELSPESLMTEAISIYRRVLPDPQSSPRWLISGAPEQQQILQKLQRQVDSHTRLSDGFDCPTLTDAYAASVQPLIHFHPDLTLSAPAEQERRQQWQYSHLTKKSVAMLGTIILLLGGLLYGIQGALFWQHQEYENALAELSPLFMERSVLQKRSAQLSEEIANINYLTAQHSNFNYYFFELSKALPDEAWFIEVELEPDDEETLVVLITGLTTDNQAISRFIQNLELLDFTSDINLKQTLVYSGKDVWRKFRLKNKRIIQFQVALSA